MVIITDVTMIEIVWRILPAALLVPFITYFLARIGNYNDRKLEYRTFIETDEIVASYKLKNLPNLKNGTRLIIPEEYKDFDNYINNSDPSSFSKCNYLKIKTFGKSIITGVWISVTMKSNDRKKIWDLDISIPIIDVNEEIFIPIDRFDNYGEDFYTGEIKINYQTQTGEKLLYKCIQSRNRRNETVVTNSHYLKKYHLFYRNINKNKGSNISWIFLNTDKDKAKE